MTIRKCFVLFLGGALVACGGGGGSSSSSSISTGGGPRPTTLTETVTITPSLGRITDATVKIYDANYENVIGEGTLDESGKAQVEVTYTAIEPTIVEVIAGENSTYFDEAAGEIPLPEGTRLRAMTSEPSNTAVTPLTELAWQLALQHDEYFPLDVERVKRLNGAVSELFTGGFESITYPPVILSEMPAPNSQTIAITHIHAAMLGALAKMGESEGAPALAVMDSLSSDISDGILNSPVDSYVYANFTADFRRELDDWIETYGNEDAQAIVFATPLPANTIDNHAAVPLQQRLLDMEYSANPEVAYSRADDAEWDLFPVGATVKYRREDNVIGVTVLGTPGFVPGWSVDITTATYRDDPLVNGIRVDIPTGDPLLDREIIFVSSGRSGMQNIILLEQDYSDGPDKLAHALVHESSDFMEPRVENFFDDVHALAQGGATLTVIVSDEDTRECATAAIGTNNSSRYPKVIGIIHADGQDTWSLEPPRIRYAKAGPQREILFDKKTIFRLGGSGRVDVISMSNGGLFTKQWATNDPELISKYCP